ncbi:MAG: terminase small subunit [Carnobacterium sp.]|uniref:terminase small subunit n=1 Tax=Carnobacterium sp. TaxID=48221 RepID=UPI003C71BFD5
MNGKDYGLTMNMIKFCENYLLSGNGGQSYVEAYSSKGKKIPMTTGYSSSSLLLKKENIQEYLKDRRADQMKQTDMTAGDIIAKLVELANDPAVKTSDRLNALKMLGQNLAMFTDRVEGGNNMNIEINLDGEELK